MKLRNVEDYLESMKISRLQQTDRRHEFAVNYWKWLSKEIEEEPIYEDVPKQVVLAISHRLQWYMYEKNHPKKDKVSETSN